MRKIVYCNLNPTTSRPYLWGSHTTLEVTHIQWLGPQVLMCGDVCLGRVHAQLLKSTYSVFNVDTTTRE